MNEMTVIDLELVAPMGGAAAQRVGEVLAEFQTPLADRLVGDHDAARGQQFLDVAIAQGEVEIEPDGVADDLRRIMSDRLERPPARERSTRNRRAREARGGVHRQALGGCGRRFNFHRFDPPKYRGRVAGGGSPFV